MEHQGLLEVRNLKKYFDTPRGPLQAVDNVSFSIEKGKTLEWWGSPDAENPLWAGPFSGFRSPPPGRSV